MPIAQPVVIISTGRTGTDFFSKLFGEVYANQVDAYHERGISRPIQIFTNLYFAHLLPKSVLCQGWRLFKGWEVPACKKDFHIDSNCFLYGLVAIAPELYPNLRVIHILRDPRTYVTSHLNYARQKGTSFVGNYFIPFWQPSPFLTGEFRWKCFWRISRFERYAWIWDFKNRVMESIEGTPTPYLRLRFEDIFNAEDPNHIFRQITDFIGLPHVADVSDRFRKSENRSTTVNFPSWRDWLPSQCARLNAICGSHMKRYGYGNEADWLDKLKAS
jgi:hypothetical protein